MADAALSIVHITAPAPVGGLERVVQTLAIGQHRAGHRVRVIGVIEPQHGAHPFFTPLEQAGVPFSVVVVPARGYLAERRAVRSLLLRERPQVVHTHGYRSDLLDAPVARRLGARIVSTVHGSSRLGGKSHLFEWLQRRAWRRFDGVVVVSRALESALRLDGISSSRLHFIPNAWPGRHPKYDRAEARRRLGVDPAGTLLGFVGRLIEAKGPDVLGRALTHLPGREWSCVFIGDGRERQAVQEILGAAGLEDRAFLCGHLDDATDLFPAFDLFVLSSRTEGTPIVLFEAMAAGIPVVATAVGGVPEVVGHGEALLVPPNDPAALATAITSALADRKRSEERALAARQRLERDYATGTWLERHDRLYRQVIGVSG